MNTNYTDQQILAAIRESTATREKVFAYLYQDTSLRKMAFAKINSMVSDSATASDIYLDSLLAFIKNVRYNKFNEKSKVFTYIIGICGFQCLRYLDKQKREKAKSEQYYQEQLNIVASDKTVDENQLNIEDRRYTASITRKVFQQLSDVCKKALRQKYGQALSIKAIAEESGHKVQSVKNTLSRCYKKMRAIIQDDPSIMEEIKKNYGKF